MKRVPALLLAALALLMPGGAALAQSGARLVERVTWVEEWNPATQAWVRVDDSAASVTSAAFAPTASTILTRGESVTITETVHHEPTRFIANASRLPANRAGIARFGPFRVIDATRAALVASTDAVSPQAFAAMLAAYPGLQVIVFADAPGTSHDLANLRLGRAIRAAGLATHVPAGGSARSGAVELFLAGTRRTMDPGALFAVHSWRDEAGREPDDFAPDAPENRLYLDYYAEMGMSDAEARAFYTMTNSVPHAAALWLEGSDMARWIAPAVPRAPATRAVPHEIETAMRLALARSGRLWADALRAPWPLPHALPAARVAAPRLAYADVSGAGRGDLAAGLLDSVPAFP
ncbi:MAG: alpha/beta hydrolase [Sphingomonadales bacterium]|nr:alpha/beta hydrolase [Sphingomonadales bacterium]NCQ21957.1 alpha/beta hydrolase [Sphingomonadales bacterium]NCT04591.1 alpha/beta hydrolase [Sphingomonadales bacterium]